MITPSMWSIINAVAAKRTSKIVAQAAGRVMLGNICVAITITYGIVTTSYKIYKWWENEGKFKYTQITQK